MYNLKRAKTHPDKLFTYLKPSNALMLEEETMSWSVSCAVCTWAY